MIEICVEQAALGSLPDSAFRLVSGRSPAIETELGPWAGIHNRRIWFLGVEPDPNLQFSEYAEWPELLRVSKNGVLVGHLEAGADHGAVFFHPLPQIPVRDVTGGEVGLEKITALLASGRRDGLLKPLLPWRSTDIHSWAQRLGER